MSSVKEIRSVRNACLMLEMIAREQPVGVSELARATDIDKSALQRLAVTLHRAGWLQQTAEGRWRIAASVAQRLQSAGTDTLVAVAGPLLDEVRDRTGETAMLVVIDGAQLRVLAVSDSRHNLRITAPVGSALPLVHSSALRSIAAHVTATDLEALRRLDPSLDDDELAVTRNRGWAVNDREIVPDAIVVGAPVLTDDGVPVAAIIACAPASRIDEAALERSGNTVLRASRTLRRAL